MTNFLDMLPILLSFGIAFLTTALVTPLAIKLNKKLGLIDDPKRHKHPGMTHTVPVPRGGGIPLFIGAFVAGVILLPVTKITLGLLLAAFIALIIGTIDDKLNADSKDVSPYLRLLVNILCAIIVVGCGVSISFITHPFGGVLDISKLSLPLFKELGFSIATMLTILWIIWVMNMLNWSKGVDGQMPGIVTISAVVIGILSLRFAGTDANALIDAKLAFIVAGSMAGFLIYNFYPQKIMPGYGATAMYLLLAVASIHSSSKLATAVLVMGIPTVDAIFTILRRVLARRSPFFGDKGHLHHILLKLGYSRRQVAISYWIFSIILGTISLTIPSTSKLFALIMLVVITGMILLFLHYVTGERNEKNTS